MSIEQEIIEISSGSPDENSGHRDSNADKSVTSSSSQESSEQELSSVSNHSDPPEDQEEKTEEEAESEQEASEQEETAQEGDTELEEDTEQDQEEDMQVDKEEEEGNQKEQPETDANGKESGNRQGSQGQQENKDQDNQNQDNQNQENQDQENQDQESQDQESQDKEIEEDEGEDKQQKESSEGSDKEDSKEQSSEEEKVSEEIKKSPQKKALKQLTLSKYNLRKRSQTKRVDPYDEYIPKQRASSKRRKNSKISSKAKKKSKTPSSKAANSKPNPTSRPSSTSHSRKRGRPRKKPSTQKPKPTHKPRSKKSLKPQNRPTAHSRSDPSQIPSNRGTDSLCASSSEGKASPSPIPKKNSKTGKTPEKLSKIEILERQVKEQSKKYMYMLRQEMDDQEWELICKLEKAAISRIKEPKSSQDADMDLLVVENEIGSNPDIDRNKLNNNSDQEMSEEIADTSDKVSQVKKCTKFPEKRDLSFLKALNITQKEFQEDCNRITYAPVIIRKNEDDKLSSAYCSICLDDGTYEGDEMVACSTCLVTVHQTCYKRGLLAKVPEQDWYCERCRHCISTSTLPEEVTCILCPKIKGVLIKYNQMNDMWAHLTCIEWTPELSWKDENYYKVEGKINRKRFELKCYICKSDYGACIQCDFTGCFKSFHVSCAEEAGLIKSDMEGYTVDDRYLIFCSSHATHGLKEIKHYGKILTVIKRKDYKKRGHYLLTEEQIKEKKILGKKRRKHYDVEVIKAKDVE
ncbi:unnamed protein product [Moneuplotes crassus]|uniref:Uncharacterized protein n=1 Tax=Euplotes crassus TaxID=5936 RepID=A0AAD2D7I6_EUPCR|nr:unnamed protein product [Moneuplotes crassus]